MAEGYLLDASAVLALLANEPGADKLLPMLSNSAITAINLAEVMKKLLERGVSPEDVEFTISDLRLPLIPGPADFDQTFLVGKIATAGRPFGLSMGDAVCLAATIWSDRIAVTAERRWTEAMPHLKILAIR